MGYLSDWADIGSYTPDYIEDDFFDTSTPIDYAQEAEDATATVSPTATMATTEDTATTDLGDPTKVTESAVPDWMKSYYEDLFGSASDLIFQKNAQGQVVGFKDLSMPEVKAYHAQMTPEQQQALSLLQAQTGGTVGESALSTLGMAGQALQQMRDPTSDPYLAAAAQAAVNPLYQNLAEQILPGLRGSAIGSGNLGSSRQGIAEGLASARTSQAAGDITSKMYSQAFQSGLSNYNQLLGMMPGLQQAALDPMRAQYDAGLLQQQQQQSLLDKQYQQEQWNQMYPFWALSQYQGYLGGDFGGTTTEYGGDGSSGTTDKLGGDQAAGDSATLLENLSKGLVWDSGTNSWVDPSTIGGGE